MEEMKFDSEEEMLDKHHSFYRKYDSIYKI